MKTGDALFTNGQFLTLDPRRPQAEAVLVVQGRIAAVGNRQELEPLRLPGMPIIDLEGRTVIPAFNDSHMHLTSVGLRLDGVWLFDCRSIEDIQAKVRAKAAVTPKGQWIHGVGWLETLLKEQRMPNRWDLDEAAPDHPVVLDRIFNTVACNSLALKLAGIDANTPDPPLGRIDRDPRTGEPTGIIRDRAKSLVARAPGLMASTWELVPARDDDELVEVFERAILRAGKEMLKYGVTSVCDPGLDPIRIRAYQNLYRRGELPVRVTVMPEWYGFSYGHREDFDESIFESRLDHVGVYTGFGDEWLRYGPLKMSLDGGLGNGTAYLYEPYEGQREVVVHLRVPPELLAERIFMGHRLGWSVGVHCIGDAAQDLLVESFAACQARLPRSDVRHQVIHGYLPTAKALRTMVEHNILAVVQPVFLYLQGDKYPALIGSRRASYFTPLRTYLEAGVKVVANSDAPTGLLNPLLGIYAAVSRTTIGGQVLGEEEALTVEEALPLFTVNGAYATFEEDTKGRIAVGHVADMVVLSDDPRRVSVDELKDIQVEKTILAGRVVYTR